MPPEYAIDRANQTFFVLLTKSQSRTRKRYSKRYSTWGTANVGDQYASLLHLRLARPEWLSSSDNGLTNIQLKYYVKSKLLK